MAKAKKNVQDPVPGVSQAILDVVSRLLNVPQEEAGAAIGGDIEKFSDSFMDRLRKNTWIYKLGLAFDLMNAQPDMTKAVIDSVVPESNIQIPDEGADEGIEGEEDEVSDEQKKAQGGKLSNLEQAPPEDEAPDDKDDDDPKDPDEPDPDEPDPFDPYPEEEEPKETPSKKPDPDKDLPKGLSLDKKPAAAPSANPSEQKNPQREEIDAKKELDEEKKGAKKAQNDESEKKKNEKDAADNAKDIELAQRTSWLFLSGVAIIKDISEFILSFFTGSVSELIDPLLELIGIATIYGYLYTRGKIMRKVARRSRMAGFIVTISELIPWISYLPSNLALVWGMYFIAIPYIFKAKVRNKVLLGKIKTGKDRLLKATMRKGAKPLTRKNKPTQ